MAEDFKAIAGGESVMLDKRLDALDHRQRRPGDADVEYVDHPLVLALTLVNQMVERAAGTRLHALSKALLGNLPPDAQRLQPFSAVGIEQKGVSRHAGSFRWILPSGDRVAARGAQPAASLFDSSAHDDGSGRAAAVGVLHLDAVGANRKPPRE